MVAPLATEHFLKAGKLFRQCHWAGGLDLGDPGFAGLLGPRHHRGLASRWWRRLVPSHSLGTGGRGGEWCSCGRCFTPHLHTHLCPAPRTWEGRRAGRGRGCWCPDIRPPQLEVRSRGSALQTLQGAARAAETKPLLLSFSHIPLSECGPGPAAG